MNETLNQKYSHPEPQFTRYLRYCSSRASVAFTRHLPRAQPNEGYRVTIIRILLFVNTINSRILIIQRILRWDWKQTRYIKMNILYF